MSRYTFNRVDVLAEHGTTVTGVFGNGDVAGSASNRYYADYFTETVSGAENVWGSSWSLVDLGNNQYGFPRLINQSGEQAGAIWDNVTNRESLFTIIGGQPQVTGVDMYPVALSDTDYLTGWNTADTQGVLYSPAGAVVNFAVPGASYMFPTAVANDGTVIGTYTTPTSYGQPFERLPDGQLETFKLPVSGHGTLAGVNSAGWIVGSFSDGLHEHGFLINPQNHQVEQLDVPNSVDTYITAINDQNEIGGWFASTSDTGQHGFVADLTAHHLAGPGSMIGADTTHPIGKIELVPQS